MEVMLDKKQIWAIFLFEFKMGCKAAETTCNINNAFGPWTAMNAQCSGGSRSLAKEMRALKMSIVAGHQKLQQPTESISKLILFLLLEKLPKNWTLIILVIWH